jgi:hypothetical protein
MDCTELKSLKKVRLIEPIIWLSGKEYLSGASMASRWMLNRRHISSKLTLGVLNDKNWEISSHAWVKVKRFEITDKD